MALLQLVVFQIMLVLLWSPNESVSEAASMAKPGCLTSCGEIEIPYPFGIGGGCYLDVNATSGFEMRCTNHSRPPTIYLDGQWTEVHRISVEEGTIEVSFPIVYQNCGRNRRNNVTVTLEGSPFAVSPTKNKFIAMGCDNLALISQNGSTVGGCMSICNKANEDSNIFNGTCNGVGCCQTTIPSLKEFNATLKEIDDGTEKMGCKYAYLVENRYFENRLVAAREYSMARLLGYIPVVLEWNLDDQMFKSLENQNSNISTSFVDGQSYSCNVSSTTAGKAGTASRCSCKEGFTGNPYLLTGCEDIDECQDSGTFCREPNSYCVNDYGSYRCFLKSDEKNPAKMVGLGVGAGVGGLFLFVGALWLSKVLKKKKEQKLKEKFFKQNGGLLLQEQLSAGEVNIEKIKMFNSKELEKATDHYNVNRMLGQGGQGTVYKGMLADGRIVAVKKSKILGEGKLVDQERVRQFINEVVILSQINHRNVVKVLGCCLETEVPLLVYEFIPNGALFQFLHDQNEEFPLTWDMRIRIALEIAGALAYLHSAASMPIYHRDIKSSNILLDEKYRAKVADFGTSRSVTVDQTHVTTMVQGTFGYLDPEYFRSSQFTDKSDVYSFGVVLVELLTGQKPISSTRSEESRGLAAHFLISMEHNRLSDILDSQVVTEAKKKDVMVVANLAKKCLNLNGKDRPTMKEVSMELEGIQSSQKASNVPPSYDAETECDRKEIVKTWDVLSISTGPGSDAGSSLSVDTKPLLSS